MNFTYKITSFIILALIAQYATGRETVDLPVYRYSYEKIKIWHEYRKELPRTNIEKQRDICFMLKAQLGQQGMDRIFGTRLKDGTLIRGTGRLTLPVDIPGLEQSVRLSSLNNTSSAKGYLRTLMYAEKLHRGKRFTVNGLNQPYRQRVNGIMRKGDHDIRLTSKRTGLKFNIEVKQRKSSSLSKNSSKIKKQILREIELARADGSEYIFVNRRRIPPNIKNFIESQGGYCLQNVSSKDISSQIAKLDSGIYLRRMKTWYNRSVGALGVLESAYDLSVSMSRIFNSSELDDEHDLKHINQFYHGIRVVQKSREIYQQLSPMKAASSLKSQSARHVSGVKGIAGKAAVPVFLLVETGWAYYQVTFGHISDADFKRKMNRIKWKATVTVAGGLIGGVLTAGPGAVPGAAAGYMVVDTVYVIKDWVSPNKQTIGMFKGMTKKEKNEYTDFLLIHYSSAK